MAFALPACKKDSAIAFALWRVRADSCILAATFYRALAVLMLCVDANAAELLS